jgi:hypothetical protein
VLQLNKELNVDPTLGDTPVRLPRPYENKDWPQAGGNQAHAMYHLSAGTGTFKQLWSANIGSAADSANRLLAEPVIADGKVFTLDSESLVRVFDAETGKKIWENDLTPETDDDDLFGGGIAVSSLSPSITSWSCTPRMTAAGSGRTPVSKRRPAFSAAPLRPCSAMSWSRPIPQATCSPSTS